MKQKYYLIITSLLILLSNVSGKYKIIFDTKYEKQFRLLRDTSVNGGAIGLDWMPDNKNLVYLTPYGKIISFNIETNKENIIYNSHGKILESFSISPSGKIACSYGNIVLIFKNNSKRKEIELKRGSIFYSASEISWSPDEESIIFVFDAGSSEGFEGAGVARLSIKEEKVEEISDVPTGYGGEYSIAVNYQNRNFFIISQVSDYSCNLFFINLKSFRAQRVVKLDSYPFSWVKSINSRGDNIILLSELNKLNLSRDKSSYVLWKYDVPNSILYFIKALDSANCYARYSYDNQKLAIIIGTKLYIVEIGN